MENKEAIEVKLKKPLETIVLETVISEAGKEKQRNEAKIIDSVWLKCPDYETIALSRSSLVLKKRFLTASFEFTRMFKAGSREIEEAKEERQKIKEEGSNKEKTYDEMLEGAQLTGRMYALSDREDYSLYEYYSVFKSHLISNKLVFKDMDLKNCLNETDLNTIYKTSATDFENIHNVFITEFMAFIWSGEEN